MIATSNICSRSSNIFIWTKIYAAYRPITFNKVDICMIIGVFCKTNVVVNIDVGGWVHNNACVILSARTEWCFPIRTWPFTTFICVISCWNPIWIITWWNLTIFINCIVVNIRIISLVYHNTIHTISKWNIIGKKKSSIIWSMRIIIWVWTPRIIRIVWISCYIASWSIYNFISTTTCIVILVRIIWTTCLAIIWWIEINNFIDISICNVIGDSHFNFCWTSISISISTLCNYNSTFTIVRPPSGIVNSIVRYSYIIRIIKSNTWVGTVIDSIIMDINIISTPNYDPPSMIHISCCAGICGTCCTKVYCICSVWASFSICYFLVWALNFKTCKLEKCNDPI